MKPGDLARASQHELDYQGRTSLFWSKAFRLNEDDDGGNRFVTSVGIVSIRQIKMYWRKNPGSKSKDKIVEEFVIHNTNRHLEEDIEDYKFYFMSILVGGMRGGSAVEFICSRPNRSLEAGRFELDLDDFSKDEFGGRSSTSGRVNFGNEYEEKLAATYYKMSLGMNIEKEPWAKHVAVMHKRFAEDTGCNLSFVHWAGPQNTSRPLVELNGGKSIAISSGGKTDGKIGETIQDIMVQYGGNAKKYPSSDKKPDPNAPYTFYISVKYGKTLAFFNCGVQGKGSKEATAFFPGRKQYFLPQMEANCFHMQKESIPSPCGRENCQFTTGRFISEVRVGRGWFAPFGEEPFVALLETSTFGSPGGGKESVYRLYLVTTV